MNVRRSSDGAVHDSVFLLATGYPLLVSGQDSTDRGVSTPPAGAYSALKVTAWARRLKPVFGIEIEPCARCRGRSLRSCCEGVPGRAPAISQLPAGAKVAERIGRSLEREGVLARARCAAPRRAFFREVAATGNAGYALVAP
jgi:hypothetical protein